MDILWGYETWPPGAADWLPVVNLLTTKEEAVALMKSYCEVIPRRQARLVEVKVATRYALVTSTASDHYDANPDDKRPLPPAAAAAVENAEASTAAATAETSPEVETPPPVG